MRDVRDGAAWRVDEGHFVDVDGLAELDGTLAGGFADEEEGAAGVGVVDRWGRRCWGSLEVLVGLLCFLVGLLWSRQRP